MNMNKLIVLLVILALILSVLWLTHSVYNGDRESRLVFELEEIRYTLKNHTTPGGAETGLLSNGTQMNGTISEMQIEDGATYQAKFDINRHLREHIADKNNVAVDDVTIHTYKLKDVNYVEYGENYSYNIITTFTFLVVLVLIVLPLPIDIEKAGGA